MNLCLFDLDNTLLRGDSDYEWTKYLVENNLIDEKKFKERNDKYYIQYQEGNLNINEFLVFQLGLLKKFPLIELNLIYNKFFETKIKPMITDDSLALIKKHKKDLKVIITATNSFITKPICDFFQVEELIATIPEIKKNGFTGRVIGTPCFGKGKVDRLNEWMKNKNLEWKSFKKSYFYSDSINDLPLLELVNKPIAVNPDLKLKSIAKKRNWHILNLV
ncbi:MAG: HAD family hydrolase [Hydrogenophilales bacterium]